MAAIAPRVNANLGAAAARHLGRMPRVVTSAADLDEVLRRSAELVAEAVRADGVSIRLGGIGGTEVTYVRRPWGRLEPAQLPTRLAVPLVLRGRRLGMLTALRARRRPFTQSAAVLIGAFAGPISIAVDNARLFEALQDRLGDLARLGEASEAIASLGDLETVGAQIARQAARLVGAERGAVLLLDRDDDALATRSLAFGFRSAQLRRLSLRLTRGGTVARLLEAGGAFIANDVANDQRDLSAHARQLGDRSLLMVPLRAASHSLGILRVSNKREGLVTRQDARLLGVFAAQAAVAIENATLYEEAVRERERLQELERLKSQFLSLVSHELRTPLASIKASAEVLLSTAAAQTPEAHLRLLRNVDRSSDRLSALITDLLDLVRLEGGRLELERERLDVRQIVDEAVATVRPLADGRRQTVRLDLPRAPCEVDGDRRRLEQIVLNLLTNAVKYGPPATTIRVHVRRTEGDRFEVALADAGPGIAPEEQPLIFERFYRRDTDETRRSTGTGLGLPIARALAELHGGSVTLDSEPDRGSTFSLTLPEAMHEDPDR
jgi:signal transduction histidine kinase